MSGWTIYSKNGVAKYTVKELEFHDTWMGEEYVMVNITSPTPLDIEIGDYLIYRGLTYSVYSVPSALKQARRGSYGEAFKYDNIKLSSRGVELTDLRFLDYVLEDNNIHYTSLPTFSFHCITVDDLLDRLQANTDRDGGNQWYFISPSYSRTMQRYQPGTAAYTEAARLWDEHFGGDHGVEPSYERTDVNISVDKQSVWDGLIHIKNDFNLNFIMRERAVIVGGEGLSVGHMFRYGKGNGLYQIERVADQDQKVTTKLFAYGSDKNLPIRYYANITRICFAKMYARPSADSKTLYLNLVWSRSYVTGTADSNGKYPVVVSINGNTYNVKAYPYTVGARELFTIDASVSLSFVTSNTDIIFVSGIDKDKFPASNTRQMSGGMPNNMAVQVLMLPGFPQYALSELCRCTYDSVNDKTVYEIRKTPSSAYNEFMRVDGNHPVTFSNDALKPYILSGNADDLGIKEGDVHFTEGNDDNGLKEIYPSIEGMTRGDVEGTSSTERLDEIVSCDVIQDNGVFAEGVEIQNFNLVLKNIGFDLKEAFDNAGGNMTISMKDGYCGGRDFNVHAVKANANGTWTLNVERSHDESLDLWFPYSTNAAIGQTPAADEPYQIRTGDHFVLTEIEIGDTSYIWAAAMKMLRKSIIWLLDNDYTRFTYLPKVDEIYMARQHDLSDGITEHSLHDTLKSGMVMLFEDEDLGVDGSVFIDSVTIKENGNNGIPTYDVVLRNDKQVGTMQRIQNQIQSLTSYVNGGGGLTPSQIRSLINTYGAERFLSKLNDDTAQGWITVLAGLRTLEDFVESSKGGALYTDENTLAHLTSDVARIRERILGTLRIGDTTASVQTEPTLHVGGDARIDDSLEVHEDLNVTHDAVIGEILTALNHIYTNLLTSDNFTDDSAFGTGFSLSKKKNNENRSYLVVDELFVRWKAIFNELEIRRISYTGGNRVSSHAASKIVKVKDIVKKLSYTVAGTVLTLSGQVNVVGQTLNIDGGVTVNGTTATLTTNSVTYAKRCYAMKDDGTTATMNWWRVNDQARCQTFNIQEGVYQNVSNKSYWRRVLAVGSENIEIDGALSEKPYDYVDLSVADCMTGSDLPEAGDTIVQMGNRTDTSRQGFIVSEVAGTSAPDIQIFRNVNSYTLEGKRKIILSPDETHLRVNSLVIETEYDARRVPMERGDWDAIPEHKCYYYDLVQYNGATWLCIFPESGTGGVKYTTEPPSESSIYWQIYAQKGADGKDGKDGKSFNILGSYDTEEELIEAHPTGQVGDAYIVAGYLYVWDEENEEWHNSGQIKGDTGRGISSVTISYGKSNSSTTIPSTWYSSVDAVGLQAGDYLFTRMVYNYTDGEPAQSEPVYSIGYIGRDGSSPVVGDIDNEVISVACDKDGKVLAEFNKTISVKIYNGSTPVTLKDNGLTVSSASGITIDQVSAANGTFRVHIPQNNTIAQANNFTVTATANIGGADVPRVMSFVVNGVRQGADGTPATIYDLIVSLSSIKKSKDGTPSVATITATRQKTVGNTISDTTDGTLIYKIDGGSEQTYTTAIQTSSVSTGIEFIFRINGTVVDRETVPVVMDGQDGTSVEIDSSNTFVRYSTVNSAQQPADNTFTLTTPPSLSAGDYLWSLSQTAYVGVSKILKSYSVSRIGEKGDKGEKGDNITIDTQNSKTEYVVSNQGTSAPTSGWTTTIPSVPQGQFLWTRVTTAYSDGSSTVSYGVSYNAEDGADGADGADGTSVTITSKSVKYAVTNNGTQPADSSFTYNSIPPLELGQYLWTKTEVAYSDGNSTKAYSVSRLGTDGEDGQTGADGYTTHFAYATSADGSQGFSTTNFNGATYIGTYRDQNATDSTNYRDYTWTEWKGEKGDKGDDGRGISGVNTFYYASVSTPSRPSGNPSQSGWVDDGNSLITSANANKHLYECTCTIFTNNTYSWTVPVDDGLISDMAATSEEFALSDSGTTEPTSGWSSSVTPTVGKWIWSRTKLTFRSGNPSYVNTQCVGYCGTDGESITKASDDTYRYAIGDSGITPPSSGWSSTKPSTFEQNKWMWTETTIHWSDNSTTVLYSAERNPNDGVAGQDIVVDGATVMKYAVSNNNTQIPTVWYDYSEIVSQITAGIWLWSMATTYYRKSGSSAGSHDAGSSVNYSVSYNGTNGADGRALTSITEYYKATNSSSPMSKPSSASGWDDDPNLSDLTDKWDANHIYLWNMEQMVYTESDGTTTTDYTIPKMLAIWTKDGDAGRGIDSIVNHYKISNSLTPPAKTDSGWSDTPVSPTASNPYLWNYETTTWVNPSSTTDTDVVMIGHFGKDGISVRAQYSANGTSWHDTFASTDKWMRTSTDNGTTWSSAMKIVGENGAETDFSFGISQYKTTADAHTAPSDISTWSDAPIAVTEQKPYLWSKVVQKNGSGTVIDTSYIRMTGEDGTSVTIDTSNTYTKYQKGDSGTTIPTGTWQPTIPPVEQGKYLWTWVHTAYSDGSYTDVYTPTYQSNDGTDSLPLAYLNLSDSVVDIEVDENGKATEDFYEEITYTMGASGKTLYIKRVDVSTVSHVSIPAYILSPLADGLITVSGTTATLTKGGVTVSGTKATLPYGYTALPQIVVSAQDGETINEGVVEVSGVAIDTDGNEYTAMSIFKVARQYYAPALQLVLSQDTMILKQNESGHKDIDLTDAYTDVALRIGGTDITSDLSIATEVSQFYDEEDEHYINSCNVSVVGNRVRITAIGSYSYIPSGSTDEKIVYCEKGYVDITATYRGVPYTKRFSFVCELLGTWFEKVENDTQKIVAHRISYVVNNGDPTKTIEQTKNTFTQMSSSVGQVSEWKEEKENVYNGYDQRITNTNTRVSNAESNISTISHTRPQEDIFSKGLSDWVLNDTDFPDADFDNKYPRYYAVGEITDIYSPVVALKAGEYCFSAYVPSDREFDTYGNTIVLMKGCTESDPSSGSFFPASNVSTVSDDTITIRVTENGEIVEKIYYRRYATFRITGNTALCSINLWGDGAKFADVVRPKLEVGSSATPYVMSSSVVKQTADALTVQINGKATQSDINVAADKITATIKSKLGETGVNIDDKTITMKAEQTIFKDLSGREMISFEMVEYDGDNLPSLVFWDNKGKKGGNKSFILNWRGLLDMAQQSTPRLWGNEVMYGTLITDNSSFAEGSKVYAETLWFNIEPREGVHSSIIRVTKYMYNAGYTISEGRKIWNPANAGDYDGKTYDSNDEELYLPTGVITVGWYISEITEYKTGTKAWRKTFSFKHYTGGMPDSSFVVCVDILSVYDIHGQIISTEYQINESLTDPSVTTGSDTAGEYIIIPTVNN